MDSVTIFVGGMRDLKRLRVRVFETINTNLRLLKQEEKYSLFKALPVGTELKMRSHYSVMEKDQVVTKVSMKNDIVVCKDAEERLCDIPFVLLTCLALETADQL